MSSALIADYGELQRYRFSRCRWKGQLIANLIQVKGMHLLRGFNYKETGFFFALGKEIDETKHVTSKKKGRNE